MAKTKKLKKTNIYNENVKGEIYGIIITAISLLIGLSIFIKPTGAAGELFRNIFLGLLGIGAYILPILTLFIGLALIINNGKIKLQKKFLYICLSCYVFLLIIHVNYSLKNFDLKYSEKIIKAYAMGLEFKGGGALSEIITSPLTYAFGKIGTYIVLLSLLSIFIIFITDVSLGDLFKNAISKFKNNRKEKSNEVKLQEASYDNLKETDEKKQYEENIDKIDKKIKILDFVKTDKDETDKNEDKDNLCEEINKEKEKNKNIDYIYPPIDILNENEIKANVQDKKELLNNAKVLEDTLLSFGVEAKVVQVSRGPSVTRYELHPSPGIKVSRIVNLSDDLALNLAAPTVRIEAPIPGKAAVGIEVPNKEIITVTLREVIDSNEFREFNSKLAFALGKDITGNCIIADLSKMPHILIAGATGSGKSVCINSLIASLIYKSSPEDVKMLMIDPKVVELSVYNGIPHLLIPVVTDPKKASSALYWAVNEMTQRYKLFAENNVRNIETYNKLMEKKSPENKLPRIVIIIDELADLMMVSPGDVEDAICRLSQMARAAGMHLVIATQRPSVDVITGVIKANIPSRISFAVSSQIDSRTILDMSGAEKLLGRGDMLFLPIGEIKPIRIQGAFISEKEVERLVEFLKKNSDADYKDDIIDEIEKSALKDDDKKEEVDELFNEAIKICIDCGQASASMLQRRLRIGFNRASRLIEEMESRGIVGPQEGSKPRQVLVGKQDIDNY